MTVAYLVDVRERVVIFAAVEEGLALDLDPASWVEIGRPFRLEVDASRDEVLVRPLPRDDQPP